MHRHGLEKHLKTSAGTADMEYVPNKPNGSSVQRIDDVSGYNARLVSVAEQFFGIDGMTPREVIPYHHEPLRPQTWHKYDHLSCQDRLDQLDLPQEDKDLFIPHTNSFGSSPAADSAWTDALLWYAAGGYSFPTMYDAVGCFKLGGGGTTNMCRHILAEYQGDRLFNKAVSSVKQTNNLEVVITVQMVLPIAHDERFRTIPLDCLSDIKFDPPLSPNKQIAVQEGHINFGEKYHISLDEPQGNWFTNTCDKDSAFLFGIKDHNGMSKLQAPLISTGLVTDYSRYTVYKSRGTYAMMFGHSGKLQDPIKHEEVITEFEKLQPEGNVRGYVAHTWSTDPFTKGAWFAAALGWATKNLKALQEPHGRIFMASADWAQGWRGFVDGAIEQGARAAAVTKFEFEQESSSVAARL